MRLDPSAIGRTDNARLPSRELGEISSAPKQENVLKNEAARMFEHADMYRLPGDSSLTEKDFKRYFESNARFEEQLSEMLVAGLENSETHEALSAFRMLVQKDFLAEYPAVLSFVNRMIESGDYGAQRLILDYIPVLKPEDRGRYIDEIFEKGNIELQEKAASFLKFIPPNEGERLRRKLGQILWNYLTENPALYESHGFPFEIIDNVPEGDRNKAQEYIANLIKEALRAPSLSDRRGYAYLTCVLPSDMQKKFINQYFSDKNTKLTSYFLREMGYRKERVDPAFFTGLPEVIERGLNGENDDFAESLSDLIPQAPVANRGRLVEQALSYPSQRVRSRAVSALRSVSSSDLPLLVDKCLSSSYSKVAYTALDHLNRMVSEEKISLQPAVRRVVEKMLDSDDYSDFVAGLASFPHLSPFDQELMLEKVPSLLDTFFKDPDIALRIFRHFRFDALPHNVCALIDVRLPELLKEVFSFQNREHWSQALRLIDRLPMVEKDSFYDLAVGTIKETYESGSLKDVVALLGELSDEMSSAFAKKLPAISPVLSEYLLRKASHSPLYNKFPEPFTKEDFAKDGSTTTLLDRIPGLDNVSLRERVIIRHIGPQYYAVWKKAYEAIDCWKRHGFNYVPVEPIVGVSMPALNKPVDVYTRVINGPSAALWLEDGGLYQGRIDQQIHSIKLALSELGIIHGHDYHKGNFVVCFERDGASGKPILTAPPRVYVIDFDQATSIKEKK